jgi:putative MATE family efflux protein
MRVGDWAVGGYKGCMTHHETPKREPAVAPAQISAQTSIESTKPTTMAQSTAPAGANKGKFVTGSIPRHILVMTGAGAVGLMAIFLGELANMLFLARLNDVAVVSAAGYSGSILFFATSIGIGLSIAATAVVSPALGAGAMTRARRLAVNAHLLTFVVSAILAALLWLAVPQVLHWLGAAGRSHALAVDYLRIILPALPALALAMTSAAILRSVGDAPRSMYVTLFGALVNVALDPLLIFTFGLGIHGAAIATVIGRLIMMAAGLHGVMRVHQLMGRPKLRPFLGDTRALLTVAVPAVLANVASPVGAAFVVAAVAPFGDAAVAGYAIINRIQPVAFGAIFALTSAVGPILGQNLGAGQRDRVRATLTNSLAVTTAFALVAWLLLLLLQEPLVRSFSATGETAALIRLFCRWIPPLFMFFGYQFVANACFNTLGRPQLSTVFNWARATVGTVPFMWLGAKWGGAAGAIIGSMLGGVVLGVAAIALCYRIINALPDRVGGTAPSPTAVAG